MNEFTAKKLGEVMAFTQVGLETFDKSKGVLQSIMGEDKVATSTKTLLSQKDIINTLADRAGTLATVLDKFERVVEKLHKIRDLYEGDQWQDPIELMEWLGFFEGGAVVHASLLTGAAEEIGHAELLSLSNEVLNFHKDLLESVTELLHLVGRKEASE